MRAQGEARYNKEGEIIRIWGAAQDITNRKKSRESFLKMNMAIYFSSYSIFKMGLELFFKTLII